MAAADQLDRQRRCPQRQQRERAKDLSDVLFCVAYHHNRLAWHALQTTCHLSRPVCQLPCGSQETLRVSANEIRKSAVSGEPEARSLKPEADP
jgi:hypothetical protein